MAIYLQVRDTAVHTAVHTYTHADTGRTITQVGTIHFGEPAYFQHLRDVIEKLEAGGATVHCEGTRTGTTTDKELLAQATDEERAALKLMSAHNALTLKRVAEWGWTFQQLGLPARGTWHNHDLTALDIIRALGPQLLIRRFGRTAKFLDWPATAKRKPHLFRLSVGLSLRLQASDRRERRRPHGLEYRNQALRDVVNRRRTELALTAAEQHLTTRDTDLVLVWGASHLTAFGLRLEALGFTRTDTTWHRVGALPRIHTLLVDLLLGRTLPVPVSEGEPVG